MKQENKILFWFRNDLNIQENNALIEALVLSTELIPVFCFDPRESGLIKQDSLGFYSKLFEMVASLRHELRLKGSNLLVVHDKYEKIIPSLARVLGVTQVYSDGIIADYKSINQDLERFRNFKALEVKQLLKMHSVAVHLGSRQNIDVRIPQIFPGFPDVNPGEIPAFPEFG